MIWAHLVLLYFLHDIVSSSFFFFFGLVFVSSIPSEENKHFYSQIADVPYESVGLTIYTF